MHTLTQKTPERALVGRALPVGAADPAHLPLFVPLLTGRMIL